VQKGDNVLVTLELTDLSTTGNSNGAQEILSFLNFTFLAVLPALAQSKLRRHLPGYGRWSKTA
jgi:hypothetical protein